MFQTVVPIILMIVVVSGFVVTNMVATHFLGPKRHSAKKDVVFECGIESVGNARLPFSVKYFLVAILFVLFDVEVIFFYPWAVNYKQLGWFGFAEMAVFSFFLTAGLIYVFKHRVLEFDQ